MFKIFYMDIDAHYLGFIDKFTTMGIWTLAVAYIQFSTGGFEFSLIKKWILTAAVLLCACLVIYLLYKDRRKTGFAIMTFVMSVEFVTNLYWSLSGFHYQSLEEYQEYTSMVKEIYDELKTENGDTFFVWNIN